MPLRKPAATAAPLDHWEGRVIQTMRKDNHVSFALDLGPEDVAALGLLHGERLRISAGGQEAEVFFHGWMKAWSMYRSFFGNEAAAALAVAPGIDAYLECDRILGGTMVPDHAQWLRVRLALAHAGSEPALFGVAVGSPVRLQVLERAPNPLPVAGARLKQGTLQATVLASHPHALTLNINFPALRKLGAPLEAWYALEADGQHLQIHHRADIMPADYESFFARPQALLFDFVQHWADEDTRVMLLRPMQFNWSGRYPDYASYTLPLMLAPGSAVTVRVETT